MTALEASPATVAAFYGKEKTLLKKVHDSYVLKVNNASMKRRIKWAQKIRLQSHNMYYACYLLKHVGIDKVKLY